MATSLRRTLVLISAVVVVVGLMAYARYGHRAAGAGGAGAETPIGVEVSSYALTLENKTELALYDIEAALNPVGFGTQFTATWGRLDTREKRDLSFGQFRGRDGTPFNRALHHPKSITVTARDLNGKTYKAEAPWR